MIGLLTRLISFATIAYPLSNTIELLASLQTSFSNNAIATLTETVPLVRRDASRIQETIAYWILLSLWLYIIQCQPFITLIQILPFASLLVLYFQVWLTFPIIPLQKLNKKVTGSFIIYDYYFSDNMKHLKELQSYYKSRIGLLGVYICHLILKFPVLNQLIVLLGVDLKRYESFFAKMAYGRQENATSQVPSYGTMNNWTRLWGIVPNWNAQETQNQDVGILKIVAEALVAPWSFNLLFSQALNSDSKVKTPSPTGSFDDFAFVNEKELNEAVNSTINIPKRRVVSEKLSSTFRQTSSSSSSFHGIIDNNNDDQDDNENSSLLGSAKKITSRSISTSSSWFRSK